MELNKNDIDEIQRVIGTLNLNEAQQEELNDLLREKDYLGAIDKIDFYLQLEIRNLDTLERFRVEAADKVPRDIEDGNAVVQNVQKAAKLANYYLENALQQEEEAEDQAIVLATEQVAADYLKLREKIFRDADEAEIEKVKDKLR